MSIKVLVCGGRNFNDWTLLAKTLLNIHNDEPIGCIIEGGANGADSLAVTWAIHHRIAVMTFSAHWKTIGNRAGPIRNFWMLEYGNPDLVVAFPGGAGTADMVRKAKAAGKKVIEVIYEDEG